MSVVNYLQFIDSPHDSQQLETNEYCFKSETQQITHRTNFIQTNCIPAYTIQYTRNIVLQYIPQNTLSPEQQGFKINTPVTRSSRTRRRQYSKEKM